MKWFKRGLWLTAWSFWLWLGFGLYRELPRMPGRLASKLSFERDRDRPVGFIADTDNLVAIRGMHPTDEKAVEVYEAATRKRLQTFPTEEFTYEELASHWFAKRHGVLFVTHNSRRFINGDGGPFHGLNMLDVTNGRWRRITTSSLHDIVLHDDQPWIAFFEYGSAWPRRKQVILYDFVADKRLLVRVDRADSRIVERPFFIPARATLVIPVRSPGPNKTLDDVEFELWDLNRKPLEPRVVKGWRVGDQPSIAANGRVAFGAHDPASIHVFSIDEGRLLFSDVANAERPIGQFRPQHHWINVGISRDGKRAIGSSTKAVWDVDSGKKIWRTQEHQTALAVGDGEHFQVLEQWGNIWNKWFPSLKYNSVAIRRFDTGQLVHRAEQSTWISPLHWNSSRTLAVDLDGSVHRLPYVVNWSLLALCQTILALPLVLLWALLRWRRVRRLKP